MTKHDVLSLKRKAAPEPARQLVGVRAYLLATICVVVGVIVRQALDPLWGDRLPFATFFLAELAVLQFVGAGPLVFTILAGFILGNWFFVSPRHSLFISDRINQVNAVVFFLISFVLLFFSQRARRAQAGERLGQEELRRHVEELRESGERFSSAFQNAAIGMALMGLDGRWLQVNRALCEQFGYSETELLATTFQNLTHPDDLEKDLAYVRQMLSEQIHTYQMEKRYYHKSGNIVWGLLSVSLVRNSQDVPAYFIAQIQDITERKQAELEARRSRSQLRDLLVRFQQLREEERTRIAREVHDVLGQMLTGLKMDMSWWERRFTKIADNSLRRALEEKVEATSRLVDMMIETVQKISHELRPSVLDNIGLEAALQFEARQFQERTAIFCEVSVPSDTVSVEPAQATGIFRVFQELLTNVARHAQATRVLVALSQSEEKVTLEVNDNGRGIGKEKWCEPKSLGLLGMTERASHMGGSFNIHRRSDGGTTATLTIPRSPDSWGL
jgi:PAS domain S-box-containing protein